MTLMAYQTLQNLALMQGRQMSLQTCYVGLKSGCADSVWVFEHAVP